MTCEICGTSHATAGDGIHECSSEPLLPARRNSSGRFLEDHSDGHVDNAGYWERKDEAKARQCT